MSLAPALPRDLPADLEAQRYELARARQLARAWAETLPEPKRRDMAALFTRVAIETYSAEARPHASLSAPFAKPYGRLDRAVAELAQVVGREAAPLPITEAVARIEREFGMRAYFYLHGRLHPIAMLDPARHHGPNCPREDYVFNFLFFPMERSEAEFPPVLHGLFAD